MVETLKDILEKNPSDLWRYRFKDPKNGRHYVIKEEMDDSGLSGLYMGPLKAVYTGCFDFYGWRDPSGRLEIFNLKLGNCNDPLVAVFSAMNNPKKIFEPDKD